MPNFKLTTAIIIGLLAAATLTVIFLFICLFKKTKKFNLAKFLVPTLIGVALITTGVCMVAMNPNDVKIGINTKAWDYKTTTLNSDYASVELNLISANVEIKEGKSFSYTIADGLDYKINSTSQTKLSIVDNTNLPFNLSIHETAVPNITVTIPTGKTVSLTVKLNAGELILNGCSFNDVDLTVNAGIVALNSCQGKTLTAQIDAGKLLLSKTSFDNMENTVDAGSIKCNAVAFNVATMQTKIGTIEGTMKGSADNYYIYSRVDMGKTSLSNRQGTAEKALTAKCEVGSIDLSFIG